MSDSPEVQAALAVAQHFDAEAFACQFAGQTSINLPNYEQVVVLPARVPTDAPGHVPALFVWDQERGIHDVALLEDVERALAAEGFRVVPTDAPGPGLLDGLVAEVRDAVLEADAQDCSSADCIANAVYEIVRARMRRAASPAPSRPEGLDVAGLLADLVNAGHDDATVAYVRARLSDATTQASR